ncbi:MAG: hypothetical protein HUU46_14285 [Candidatus Hydrogenedentes bacterium]|nr:hypothetical protein [Candidatus Hydrogenedentota bacterium]
MMKNSFAGVVLVLCGISLASVAVADEEQISFVPEVELEGGYAEILYLGQIQGAILPKDDADTRELMRWLPENFLETARRFIRLQYLPDLQYVEQNLILSRVPGSDLPNYSGQDCAYLSFTADGRNLLLATTYGGRPLIGISFNLTQAERQPFESNAVQAVVKRLLDKYLIDDPSAPFTPKASKKMKRGIVLLNAFDGKVGGPGPINYRQTMLAMFSDAGLSMTFWSDRFTEAGYIDVPPKWDPPPDKYFDHFLKPREEADESVQPDPLGVPDATGRYPNPHPQPPPNTRVDSRIDPRMAPKKSKGSPNT